MKYSIIALFLPVILMSCAGQNDETGDSNADGASDNPYAAGEKIYTSMCISCHQKNGEGVVGAFPPLANSDYLLADINRSIDIVKNGMQGEIVVNGQTYNGIMANQGLTDEDVRDVTNYILNTWGNKGGEVSLDDVKTALK